ncbi:MAG: ArsR family transcriptional regulator [Candidatus Thermoplasmatota archaeon]|nr:ArsR family transcriptional regulator [Candidatus Thermoplasmatota archaeon]
MNRIKFVNEPAELVPILMAVDKEVKREVLKDVSDNWRTAREIEEKFGEEGLEALKFFEKMNLVETKWQTSESDPEPEKSYHAFYTSFHINASSPVNEMCDILAAVVMPENEYRKIEDKILKEVDEEGKFSGDIADDLGVSQTMLKGLIKRSAKLEYKGHQIRKLK